MLQDIMCIYHNPELLENLHFPEKIKYIPLIYTQSERLERFQLSLNFIISIFSSYIACSLRIYVQQQFCWKLVKFWFIWFVSTFYIVYLLGKIYTFFQNCYKNVYKEALPILEKLYKQNDPKYSYRRNWYWLLLFFSYSWYSKNWLSNYSYK